MNPVPPVNILVAPLDWGLGHATRCIPLVHEFLRQGCQVFLAGEGRIKTVLKKEFPLLPFFDLPGYNISYPGSKWKMPFKIASQIPQILQSIQQEHEWLEKAALENQIHGIISDNRYGLYRSSIPCVFITHQLRIQSPLGKLAGDILQDLNYSYVNKFSFCWIPDVEGNQNLSGELSHPQELPQVKNRYIGPLSRLIPGTEKSDQFILLLLSGPEPQRTAFEQILISEMNDIQKRFVVVRGLPGGSAGEQPNFPSHAKVYDHLPSEELSAIMRDASFVIARSGYSTVMDLAHMKKKSILVPTPGQTEQEYLAQHLMKNNYAFCVEQDKFRLKQVLELASHFPYAKMPSGTENKMKEAVKEFIEIIGTKAAGENS